MKLSRQIEDLPRFQKLPNNRRRGRETKAREKVARHFRNRCRTSGKVQFHSHERALLRIASLMENDRQKKVWSAYLCPHCRTWHLSTNRRETDAMRLGPAEPRPGNI